ncbi:lysylphosphatidylglycerol synthase transmembrane domain-containing protein [Pseudopedobacter beijingensis]|uniref:Lysylphosphatidylglycerol synthase transmembrane domain-containing protein n=1 Tax=Pseudopedobacter beijingensis TaxID=1207056 RepID=A0ABW4IEP7_9SPHI
MFKQGLKLTAKIAITTFALYWVFKNTDIDLLWKNITKSDPLFLLLAILSFLLSQLFAAARVNIFFHQIKLSLNKFYNYKLYLVGMFYNVFLPGGIGGEGYKIYFLNKNFGTDKRQLITAIFLDKLSGLWAICLLICSFIPFIEETSFLNIYSFSAIIAGTTVYILLYKIFFKQFFTAFPKAHLHALGLQVMQVACVIFILFALKEDQDNLRLLPYLTLFLASAFMALFPFTIGGLGARELVFLYGSKYLELDPQIAVTLSLLFFAVSAICSLPGGYFIFRPEAIAKEKNSETI